MCNNFLVYVVIFLIKTFQKSGIKEYGHRKTKPYKCFYISSFVEKQSLRKKKWKLQKGGHNLIDINCGHLLAPFPRERNLCAQQSNFRRKEKLLWSLHFLSICQSLLTPAGTIHVTTWAARVTCGCLRGQHRKDHSTCNTFSGFGGSGEPMG